MNKSIAVPFVDFRSIRNVFVDPALSLQFGMKLNNHDDVIDQNIWNYLTSFPDSAAIRTSGQCGTTLKKMYDLIPSSLMTCNDSRYPHLGLETLAASEDFEASIFNALHGYYRQAYHSLRSALEFIVKGVAMEVQLHGSAKTNLLTQPDDLSENAKDISFGTCCDYIRNNLHVKTLENKQLNEILNGFFRQKNPNEKDLGGWIWQLYGRLSKYPHSHREYINTKMWGSIGPVFNEDSFHKFVECYFETSTACILLLKLVRKDLRLVPPFTELATADVINKLPVVLSALDYLFRE